MTNSTGAETATAESTAEPVHKGSAEVSPKGGAFSMFPALEEEVETEVRKDGISYIFESRSLSSVIRFIYTPIDGTFSDLELELNNADPIKPAEEGGIAIEMGGQQWPADSEEVERHFVSCELVGDRVEARWQWKFGEELAHFLYRFSIRGKSLVIEVEGGNGKATGLSLGRVAGALHPRLIEVPYLTLGESDPRILCTSDMFVSSLIDWYYSSASSLFAPEAAVAVGQVQLNGGCTYQPRSDGRRVHLRERWLLTASCHFAEVLPSVPVPESGRTESLAGLAWFNIPRIEPSEEGYIELYETLRSFKQWQLDHLLINHPADTWHDGDGDATLRLEAAPAKGGDDALGEYLEAVQELGYKTALHVDFHALAATSARYADEMAALQPDGKPLGIAPGLNLLKAGAALSHAGDHLRAVSEKYGTDATYIGLHAALPPWAHNDFDARVEGAGQFATSFRRQRELLAALAEALETPLVGEGGCHWLYTGLLNGYLARLSGPEPWKKPLLVDFALRNFHTLQTDAGAGTIEQFFAAALPAREKHARSPYLDRYLATTLAFGHAAVLPDPAEWGLASSVKTYYLLHRLQACYLRAPVSAIHYHHDGNMLETTEALLSDAYQYGQVRVSYENGTVLYVNGGDEQVWQVQIDETTYSLPPASFLGCGPDGLLAFSADRGAGRIDYAACPEYLYCDTRGVQMQIGAVQLNGAAVIMERKWEIDILPIDCEGDIEVDVAHFWPDRRLPPLRILAFKADEDGPDVFKADMDRDRVRFRQIENAYKYRITLPEWMVEPGQ